MSTFNKWVTGTFAGVLFSAIVGSGVYSLITSQSFWSVCAIVATWFYNALLTILNFQLRVWWILVALAGLLLIIIVVDRKGRDTPALDFKPKFLSYKQDSLGVFTWRWEYVLTKTGWAIKNLTAYCPNCDTILPGDPEGLKWGTTCVRCGTKYTEYGVPRTDDYNRINLLIHDNIRKMAESEHH